MIVPPTLYAHEPCVVILFTGVGGEVKVCTGEGVWLGAGVEVTVTVSVGVSDGVIDGAAVSEVVGAGSGTAGVSVEVEVGEGATAANEDSDVTTTLALHADRVRRYIDKTKRVACCVFIRSNIKCYLNFRFHFSLFSESLLPLFIIL